MNAISVPIARLMFSFEKQKERTEKKAKQKLMTAIWRFMGVVIEIIELLSEHWLWLVMRDTRSKWENCAIKALFARCNELARLDDGIRYSVFRKRLMRLTNEDFQAASGFVDEEDKWSIKTKFIFYFRKAKWIANISSYKWSIKNYIQLTHWIETVQVSSRKQVKHQTKSHLQLSQSKVQKRSSTFKHQMQHFRFLLNHHQYIVLMPTKRNSEELLLAF